MSLTNPGGLGTVASVPRLMAGQGSIIAVGAIGYPGRILRRARGAASGVRRQQGHDRHQHLRPPRHPGRGVGRVPGDPRPPAPGRPGFYELVEESLQLSAVELSAGRDPRRPPSGTRRLGPVAPEMLYHVAAAMALVKAFRMHGHLAAQLDPLGTPPIGDPALDPGPLGLTPEVMAAIPSKVLRIAVPGRTLAESLPHLQRDLLRHDGVRDRAHLDATRSGSGCGRRSSRAPTASRWRRRSSGACCTGSPRSRRSSGSCTRPTWARSASRSKAGHAGADARPHHRARRRERARGTW